MSNELLMLGLFLLIGGGVCVFLALPVSAGLLAGGVLWAGIQFSHLLRLRRRLLDATVPIVASREVWGDVYRCVGLLTRKKTGDGKDSDLSLSLGKSLASLPYGFVIVSRNGHIDWFNDAAARLLQLSRPSDIGREIVHLIRHPQFATAFADQGERAAVNLRVGERHLMVHILAFIRGYRLIAVQDMSYVHYLERTRSEMLGNVAHELKTPLTVIGGYAEIIHAAVASSGKADTASAVEHIIRQAVRMNRIIDDLLTLEHLDDNQSLVESGEAISLRHLADEVVAEMATAKSEKQCKIRVDIASDAIIYGNYRQMYSVLSNLVNNAMRYSPESGTVKVSWFRDGDGGHLAVSDEGPGIEAVHLPRLTERFYRADRSRSRELGGTGLGLAIVKRVLQRHSASLRIESELGEGSVFYCDFPPASPSLPALGTNRASVSSQIDQ